MSPDTLFPSVTTLSRALHAGELRAPDLLDACLDRIERLDGALNAFRLVTGARAHLEAERAQDRLDAGRAGPLTGIPYAVKDLIDVAGTPTTAGFSGLEGNLARSDAAVVQRLSEAGMILVGKTNTHQFAFGGTGINHDHGTPRNPWTPEPHVPGGSSSGSAVAVAAGLVPMALGTDTGGSVRIPAALCGITGLKTTVGRVSRRGVFPLSPTLDSVGPICRTALDAALVYDAVNGPDPLDDSTRGLARDVLSPGLADGIEGVRVALPLGDLWDDVDPEVETAVRGCAGVLESLGATVEEVPFPLAARARAANRGGPVISAEAYTVNRQWVDHHLDRLDPVVGPRLSAGSQVSAADYIQALRTWRELQAEAEAELSRVDALLCPTTPDPALPVDVVDADLDTYLRWNGRYLRNTTVGNVLGLCGLSLPCGFTDDGRPIGAMLYGGPFKEERVLRVGVAMQRATRWHLEQPPL